METIRKEVQAFVRATETLLSPIILGKPLNEDERGMVAMCVQSLEEKYPRGEASEENLFSEQERLLHQSRQLTKETRAVIDRTRMEIRDSKADVRQMRERANGSRSL